MIKFVLTFLHLGADAAGRNSTTPRSGAESARRAETPDRLPPEDPEETT